MSITTDNNCRLCNSFEETIEHIFINCHHAIQLWTNINIWLNKNCNIPVNLDKITILMGYQLINNIQIPINTIIITAKNYLFQMAKNNSIPLFNVFLTKLKNVYHEQKTLAIFNNELIEFNKKWHKFLDVMN